MRTNRIVVVLAAGLAAACGGGSEGIGSGVDAQTQSYEAARGELAQAVTAYGTAAGIAQTDEGCRAAEEHYGAAARPALERMRDLSGRLAADGRGMQMMGGADLGCGVEAMTAELARHQGAACSGDAAQNRAEAEHHAGAMSGWLEQQRQRCEAMQGGSAAPWACEAHGDGTFGAHCGAEEWMGCAGGTCPGYADGACPLEAADCVGTCPQGGGSGGHGMM